jgi:ketosteroid isomerase-like protein
MKKLLMLVVVGSICAAFVACQPGAAGLSDQDQAAIRKVVDDAAKIATAPKADNAAYVKLYYAEDATVLPANMPPVKGQAAILAMFETLPPLSDFKPEIVDLNGRGDLAYVRGNYTMTMTPPGAPAVTDKGKYVEVWKKQADGTWKVNYDSWSSDLPIPGLMVPTGSVAANASSDVKKLSDIVGRWQIDGKFQMDPKNPEGAVVLALDCQWFAGGFQVVCLYSGTIAGAPLQETSTYSYNATTKSHEIYNVQSLGATVPGKVTIQPGMWTHVFDTRADGKPAKQRLTLTNMSPDGGDWKEEISVAGGAWMSIGGGKFAKAK